MRVEAMTMAPVPTGTDGVLGDYRLYPGCQLQVTCRDCGFARAYSPEAVIARLQQRRIGGHRTRLDQLPPRVRRRCPGCRGADWRAEFAWPPNFDWREARLSPAASGTRRRP
jgi:hypothetical protein